MKKRISLLLMTCAVTLGAAVIVMSQKVVNPVSNHETYRSPFRYVIVSTKIDAAINRKDKDRRFVEILMDRKSFSKENLVALFKLVSGRYPKPTILYANVYTDLEDVETPEEREKGLKSETGGPAGPNQKDMAIFTRLSNTSNITIHFTNGDFEDSEVIP